MITINDVQQASVRLKQLKDEHKALSDEWTKAYDEFERVWCKPINAHIRARRGDEDAIDALDSKEYRVMKDAEARVKEIDAQLSAYKRYEQTLRDILGKAIESMMTRAFVEHADELIGLPGWYKRTIRKVEAIANEALEGTGFTASVWCGERGRDISVHAYREDVRYDRYENDTTIRCYDYTGEYEKGYIAPSLRERNPSDVYEHATPDAVMAMCRLFAEDRKRLEELKERYEAEKRAILDNYSECMNMYHELYKLVA